MMLSGQREPCRRGSSWLDTVRGRGREHSDRRGFPKLLRPGASGMGFSYARLSRLFLTYRKRPARGEAEAQRQRPASVVFSVNGGSRLSRDQRPDRVCCHGWPAALEPAVREERI